jgi:hypothetical protein
MGIFNNKVPQIRKQRAELLSKVEAQRIELSAIKDHLKNPLGIVDIGIAVLKLLRSNPALVTGIVAILTIRRRGVIGIAVTGWKLWKWVSNVNKARKL